LNQKDEKINSLVFQIDYQDKEFNDMCNRFTDMNNDFENFKAIHERIINENSLLKSKYKIFEEENNLSNKRYNELNLINKKYEEETSTLTKQLNKFREDYDIIKGENEKNKMEINKYIEENFSLKIKLDDKTKCFEEMIENYENLKRTSDEKILKYESVNI